MSSLGGAFQFQQHLRVKSSVLRVTTVRTRTESIENDLNLFRPKCKEGKLVFHKAMINDMSSIRSVWSNVIENTHELVNCGGVQVPKSQITNSRLWHSKTLSCLFDIITNNVITEHKTATSCCHDGLQGFHCCEPYFHPRLTNNGLMQYQNINMIDRIQGPLDNQFYYSNYVGNQGT